MPPGLSGSFGALNGVSTASTPGNFSAAAMSIACTLPLAIVLRMRTPCTAFGTGISAE